MAGFNTGFTGTFTPIGNVNDPYRVNTAPKNATWGSGSYAQSPTGTQQLEAASNRSSAFTRYNQLAGLDPTTNEGRYIQSKFPQLSLNYEAFLAEQPNTSFEDYYRMILPQLRLAYATDSAQNRGEQISRFVRPARTIARGM